MKLNLVTLFVNFVGNMCLHPYTIKNLNRIRDPSRITPFRSLKDCTSQYINVPCGHCAECVRLRQNYLIQRIRLLSYNFDIYFQTLTMKPTLTPRISYDLDDGSTFTSEVASREYFQNYIKRVRKRKYFPDGFLYYCVSEYGGKKHRPHFHVLYFVPRKTEFTDIVKCRSFANSVRWSLFHEWSINKGTRKNPDYEELIEYHELYKNGKLYKNYDFHFVEPKNGDSYENVAFYVTKYVLKIDKFVSSRIGLAKYHLANPEDFPRFLYDFRPFQLFSKGLGFADSKFTLDYDKRNKLLQSFVDTSVNSAECGGNPYNSLLFYTSDGKSFPLSPYIRKRVLTTAAAFRLKNADRLRNAEKYLNDYDSQQITENNMTLYQNRVQKAQNLDARINLINKQNYLYE